MTELKEKPAVRERQKKDNRILHGLSEEEVESSRKQHGKNTLPEIKQKSFIRQFFGNLGDPVIRILLGALVLNLFFLLTGLGSGDKLETVGIGGSVFLATLISTLSEYTGESAFARLRKESAEGVCRVRRNGETREIPMQDVVVGDIVLLSMGELIPADGQILSGSVGVDQSPLTGESKEAQKYPLSHLRNAKTEEENPDSPSSPTSLFRGCTVLTGECVFEVRRVGGETMLGEISREVQTETRQSPLKLRLRKLAKQISVLGYIAAVIVALACLFNTFLLDSGFRTDVILLKLKDFSYVLSSLIRALTMGLTVIVVAVPEGLPMMIAVVLSSNIKRMVRDRVLVRKPVGIEAAGSMNLLFTDKTGTLTEGKLSVGEILLSDRTVYKSISEFSKKTALYPLYSLSAYANTSSSPGTAGSDRKQTAIGGNGTDRALLLSVLRQETRPETFERIAYLPFDSVRKYSAAVTRSARGVRTLVKGAPEKLLPFLTDACLPDGRTIPFAHYRAEFLRLLSSYTQRGIRVLLIACREEGVPAYRLENGQFGSLTLLCAVTLSDKIRPEAPKAVSDLRQAGIHVVMVTGDNRETATSIAEKCGILKDGVDTVLTGEEMAELPDSELRELLPRIGVIARALPSDKSRLVKIGQDLGFVVGMTGDGINDAPALKKADIGFSMGSGTQVAKDAGDIMILDNNLSSIVRAVLYGRTIFRSIRKFITLQLTMNFSAVGISMIGPFLGIDAPVTVVQMLWINLIMDTLGGLAFAGEAPMKHYLREPPKKREEPILNRYMVHQIAFLSSMTVALSLWFLKSPTVTSHFRYSENNLCLLTAFFAFFIFSSVANCFNCRTDRMNLFSGLGRNRAFLLVMCSVAVVQILFVYLGGPVLRTTPLLPKELLYTLSLSLLLFPIEFFRKILWRFSGHRNGF